ncbi:DUF4389 domain-containing protein [Arthrobacter sp. zg-Y1110]|uniref:DUF4389 domain-containing protein n=1 Tax=Arthrobacter sp. zg-Y1110 TaxID=2886932 RepID=UPI001D150D44|nr:DUF4389 domain-containing protein [Arthrobacter sp. zg-Y1110]MCC3291054.1 DUF4389 domain-containing protein [Arthrobacter sp. zg-Y1110]UWX86461.1 DUF4389 domain-containing protein [Arthrobacter sp. zg-Y1110]
MNAGRIVLIVIGSLLVLAGLTAGAGAAGLGILAAAQRDDGYLSVPEETYSVGSYALTSENVEVSPGIRAEDNIGTVQVRGTDPDGELFIGIASEADVDRYLAGVAHSELGDVTFDPFSAEYEEIPGTAAPAPPGEQDFWSVSSAGTGTQELEWPLQEGEWTVVVMNADAAPGVTADLQAGIRSDVLGPLAWWLLIGAVVLVLGGAALILAAILAGRKHGGGYPGPNGGHGPYGYTAAGPPPGTAEAPVLSGARAAQLTAGGAGAPYPARLYGELDPGLSRWLWLVKWFLAIPHYILLAFLWIAFWVATVIAGFAILFTARYPRALFDFNVGVLRWSWRVAFYASGVLGTDRYPPFSLERTDYPADFDVAYPERLSRGLVLVKWWLLVIPQALIVGAFTGSGYVIVRQNGPFGGWDRSMGGGDGGSAVNWATDPAGEGLRSAGAWTVGISLLSLLVLVAAVALLFTGRYPRPLFDFVMGLQRWSYRVLAYTALMRDEYPPFRLDQGPVDARDLPAAGGAARSG